MKIAQQKNIEFAETETGVLNKQAFKISSISAAVTLLISASISPTLHSADIEIYKVPDDSVGTTTLMFMLDISGSMGTRDVSNYPTRIESLKIGMRETLYGSADAKPLDDKVIIGLSSFDGNNGRVQTLAKALGDTVGGTYAPKKELYIRYTNASNQYRYKQCLTWHSTTQACASWGAETTNAPNVGSASGGYSCGMQQNCLMYFANQTARAKTHRDLLVETALGLTGGSTTPTPYAFAEAAAYMLGTNTTVSGNDSSFSGFGSSIGSSKSNGKYIQPTSLSDQKTNADKKECSGQGIYFLTDGQPEPGGTAMTAGNGKSGTAYNLMRTALGANGSNFNCLPSQLGNRGGYADPQNGWSCIGAFTEALLDPARNPANIAIKTAVVGFGSTFNGGTGSDVNDAKDWGTLGTGGWHSGANSKDIVNSVNAFIKELNKDIPSMSTGSSSIPSDSLSTRSIQPYAYFPQFEPKVKPEELQQLWYGNLKKYHAVNNGIYANAAGTGDPVVKASKLQDLADIWADASITYPDTTAVFAKHGALNRVILGTVNGANGREFGRKILTDFAYDGTKPVAQRYGRDLNLVRIASNYTTDNKTKTETTYARALMALFGYKIAPDVNTNGLDLTNLPVSVRQLGSVQHSLPVLLTQEGKGKAEMVNGKVAISYEGREDYVMYGSTQGLLHVLDAETGAEKFSFLPKEMIEKQSETFKENAGTTANGKNALYYGVDGQWVAHTVYVTKDDGTLTVKGAARNVVGSTTDKENLKGKQWVYGGLRMGGRSYYSLDLTEINAPKVKFHIDPTTGKIYTPSSPDGKAFSAISNMGQSWSKPTLAYVNWKGSRKLVMIVGGGYDAGGADGDGIWSGNTRTGYAGYENPKYRQDASTEVKKTIGSGVYMFDADNGDLLWHANSSTGADVSNTDLKYSVVSEIKTVDRNNDGYTDHLYFGDLAGQGFRVDFKNDGTSTFGAQINKVLNVNKTDGSSPRFYVAPIFTAHRSDGEKEGGDIVVAGFISGNKSSPLLATADSPTTFKSSLGFQFDGVYAIYDYDIYNNKSNFPTTNKAARTLATETETTSTPTKLKYINGAITGATINSTTGWGGWYYQFNTKMNGTKTTAAVIKGITDMFAMENSLYVTMFDASDNGTTSSCGAGVKGHSFTKRLCLPTGVCPEPADYTYNLGSGIVNLNVGPMANSQKGIYVPDPDNVCTGPNCKPCVGTGCKPGEEFIPVGGPPKLVPNRWYERFAKG